MYSENLLIDRLGKNIGLKADSLIFLLSKWKEEGLTIQEVEQIWLQTEDLQSRIRPGMNVRGITNWIISNLYSELSKIQPGLPKSGNQFVPMLFSGLEKLFHDSHTYYGKKGNNYLAKTNIFSYRTQEKCSYPDEKYIGVGYKDKGTQSNLVIDGSPHWKEVASNTIYQNEIKKNYSWSQFDPRDRNKLRLNSQIFFNRSQVLLV